MRNRLRTTSSRKLAGLKQPTVAEETVEPVVKNKAGGVEEKSGRPDPPVCYPILVL